MLLTIDWASTLLIFSIFIIPDTAKAFVFLSASSFIGSNVCLISDADFLDLDAKAFIFNPDLDLLVIKFDLPIRKSITLFLISFNSVDFIGILINESASILSNLSAKSLL